MSTTPGNPAPEEPANSGPPASTDPIPQSGQRMILSLVTIVSLCLTLLVAITVLGRGRAHPNNNPGGGFTQEPEPRAADGGPAPLTQVPDFQLTTAAEKSFRAADLQGKVWVVDFIFTQCKGPCPRMTSRMAQLQQKLTLDRASGDVQLLSICVDPENDTPANMRAYAEMTGADPTRWTFASGTREQIIEAATRAFRVPVDINTRNPEEPILHTQKFVLIDRQGWIRGYYDGLDPDGYEQMQKDLRLIARPSAPGK